jgi:hypothetical protein
MLFRLLAAIGLFVSAAQATVTDCGAGKALFTITELSQDPPTTVTANQNVSLTLKYTAPEEITAGTATTSVTLNFIPFSPTVEDLCVKAACPITVGEHDGSSWGLFPSGVSGSLVSKVEWKDSTDRLLLCIQSKLSGSASASTALVPWVNRTVTFEEKLGTCPANHTVADADAEPEEPKRNLRSKKI